MSLEDWFKQGGCARRWIYNQVDKINNAIIMLEEAKARLVETLEVIEKEIQRAEMQMQQGGGEK